MSYKTILVNLNAEERVDTLLDIATDLARKHQAHLIGLYVFPAVNIVPMTSYLEIPSDIVEIHDKEYEKISEQIKSKFELATKDDAYTSEWRTAQAATRDIGEEVVNNARLSDLVVVSQGDVYGSADGEAELAERLLMEAGRPMLIVPSKGDFKSVGDYVLVAWNNTQQASRATFDAAPLLEKASNVTLCWIDPPKDADHDTEIAGSEMATTLARHCNNVEASIALTEGQSASHVLLEQVRNRGADLLVMGGYGHSRMQENIFGGVTRDIFKDMTVPVLMSH